MARALFACDELSGFLVACALVNPEKKLTAVEVESVKKKMKSAGFARNVNRDDITQGTAELGVELDAHIAFVRDAMIGIASELGL
jgi:predicted hydrolase (HD superfamily)